MAVTVQRRETRNRTESGLSADFTLIFAKVRVKLDVSSAENRAYAGDFDHVAHPCFPPTDGLGPGGWSGSVPDTDRPGSRCAGIERVGRFGQHPADLTPFQKTSSTTRLSVVKEQKNA